jgi:hypothetical protein
VTAASFSWQFTTTAAQPRPSFQGFDGLVSDILSLLQPKMLTELALLLCPPGVVDALPRFTGLAMLQLEGPTPTLELEVWQPQRLQLPHGMADCLGFLPQLGSFSWRAPQLPESIAHALRLLPQLSSLELRCSQLPSGTPGTINMLPQLRSLSLEANSIPAAVVLTLPSLAWLACLELRSREAMPRAWKEQLDAAISQLPELRCLRYSAKSVMPQHLLDTIVGLTQLTLLALASTIFPALQQLTQLAWLQHLRLKLHDQSALWQPPEPAAFQSLLSFRFWSSGEAGQLELSKEYVGKPHWQF